LGNREFKVVHTPGHRPGSICLYKGSLRKLLDLDIKDLIMSHPFKPLGKSILTGNEPKEMIQASMDIAAKLK